MTTHRGYHWQYEDDTSGKAERGEINVVKSLTPADSEEIPTAPDLHLFSVQLGL